MTQSPPQVSVIMPIRNSAATLATSLDSLTSQSLAAIEIIAVDDGSTDETPHILESYAANDERLRVVQQPPRGIVTALNVGIAAARGEYLARLDADDVSYPTRLERQVAYLSRHSDHVLLGTAVDLIDGNGTRIGGKSFPSSHAALTRALRNRNSLIHSTVMIRRWALERVGGYRRALELAEDYDLWLRLSEMGKVGNLRARLGAYRVSSSSLSHMSRLPQAFAFAAARRCAEYRARQGTDPLSHLTEPLRKDGPDVDGAFAAEQSFFRLLHQFVQQPATISLPDYFLLAGRARDLGPTERRLAQDAMLSCVMHYPPKTLAMRLQAMIGGLRLDPWRAPRAWKKQAGRKSAA